MNLGVDQRQKKRKDENIHNCTTIRMNVLIKGFGFYFKCNGSLWQGGSVNILSFFKKTVPSAYRVKPHQDMRARKALTVRGYHSGFVKTYC